MKQVDLIIGCRGSGKTTALIQRLSNEIKASQKPLIIGLLSSHKRLRGRYLQEMANIFNIKSESFINNITERYKLIHYNNCTHRLTLLEPDLLRGYALDELYIDDGNILRDDLSVIYRLSSKIIITCGNFLNSLLLRLIADGKDGVINLEVTRLAMREEMEQFRKESPDQDSADIIFGERAVIEYGEIII